MNDIKVIELTNGGFTIVNEEDFKRFNCFHWQCHPKGYVIRCVKRNKRPYTIRLHREIMNAPDGVEVDHRNRRPLDNVRSNLRLATRRQNQGNAGMQERPKSAPFKGVTFIKKNANWMARIGKTPREYLGVFKTPQEAASAYNNAALKRFGDFARLNTL